MGSTSLLSGPSTDAPDDPRAATFEPAPSSGGAVRRFVAAVLREWDLAALVDDATLCATELATNAVLHTRSRFTVAVRRAGPGVRIDVLDASPAQLPDPVALSAQVADLTVSATTGRGLRIVDALASRWGFSTTEQAKTVWAELAAGPVVGPRPEVSIGHVTPPEGDAVTLRLRGLPVATAVASGIQVDDTVRIVQLDAATLPGDERRRLFDLLDRSGPARLGGRHAALRAAGERQVRYDLDLTVTAAGLAATADLADLLAVLGRRPSIAGAAVSAPVAAFRSWLSTEVAAQLGGRAPAPCPLPAG